MSSSRYRIPQFTHTNTIQSFSNKEFTGAKELLSIWSAPVGEKKTLTLELRLSSGVKFFSQILIKVLKQSRMLQKQRKSVFKVKRCLYLYRLSRDETYIVKLS